MSWVLGRTGGRAGLYLLEDMVRILLCRLFSSGFFYLSQNVGDLSQQFYLAYTLKLGTRYDYYQNDKGVSIRLASDESISIPSIHRFQCT